MNTLRDIPAQPGEAFSAYSQFGYGRFRARILRVRKFPLYGCAKMGFQSGIHSNDSTGLPGKVLVEPYLRDFGSLQPQFEYLQERFVYHRLWKSYVPAINQAVLLEETDEVRRFR